MYLVLRFTYECRKLQIHPEEERLRFIWDRVGEVLFERYGLDQAETVAAIGQVLSRNNT